MKGIKIITETELREKYKDVRLSYGLTLRYAAELLKVNPIDISKLEHSPVEMTLDKEHTIKAICHRCEKTFSTYPVLANGEFVPFPAYVCKDCIAEENSPCELKEENMKEHDSNYKGTTAYIEVVENGFIVNINNGLGIKPYVAKTFTEVLNLIALHLGIRPIGIDFKIVEE